METLALHRTSSSPFTLMCVDDNVLLVDALEARLLLEPGFLGMQRPDDLDHVVESARRQRPTIVLLDIDLPGGIDALRLLEQLCFEVPSTRVVVFTGYPSGELVSRSMGLGAWGFVSKGIGSNRLIDAIRRVVDGEAVIALEE